MIRTIPLLACALLVSSCARQERSVGDPAPSARRAPATAEAQIPTRYQSTATFAVEVDSASWDAAMLQLRDDRLPEPDSLRAEEFVAAFRYAWPRPEDDAALRLDCCTAVSPWHGGRRLLRVALQARQPVVEELPPSTQVLLLDVSTSVQRLGLREELLAALAAWSERLRPVDQVALCTFGSTVTTLWQGSPAQEPAAWRAALDGVGRGGGSDLEGGLRDAYRLARELRREGDAARVVLLSDGTVTAERRLPRRLEDLVWREARAGVDLLSLGLGRRAGVVALRELARAGDGACHLVLDPVRLPERLDPRAALVVARDVKVQIRFDPERVTGWRRLGSGDRDLAAHEFADSLAEGGELSAGAQCTALFEYTPRAAAGLQTPVTVHVRYRDIATPATVRRSIWRPIPARRRWSWPNWTPTPCGRRRRSDSPWPCVATTRRCGAAPGDWPCAAAPRSRSAWRPWTRCALPGTWPCVEVEPSAHNPWVVGGGLRPTRAAMGMRPPSPPPRRAILCSREGSTLAWPPHHDLSGGNVRKGASMTPVSLLLIIVLLCCCAGLAWASDLALLPPPEQRAQLPTDGGPEFNRLIHSASPYLLQHARNPVDWYEWGEAAFARAEAEHKPIFLSIGYSTCHWCHVMARESFEDEAVAAVLNRDFVCIKIDREERPDIDSVYMAFVQASTGHGGWPMSVWLTPDLQPFYGATYFPKESFLRLLAGISEAWRERRAGLEQHAEGVIRQLAGREVVADGEATIPEATAAARLVDLQDQQYDATWGGWSQAPKFPRPAMHEALLPYAVSGKDPGRAARAREMALETLRFMAAGGIHDHIDGGFARYSVDRFWQVPHFEKMLYDQGQLCVAYVDAWQLSGDERFAAVARGIGSYVRRRLCDPAGGLYSAEDADSRISAQSEEHAEGAFYVWRAAEIDAVLGDEAALVREAFGVLDQGNVAAASDPHGELAGRNVLIRRLDDATLATRFELSEATVAERLATGLQRLGVVRDARPRPHRDDKVLTAWNGLMIWGLARLGGDLGSAEDLAAARASAAFIADQLDVDGTLYRVWRDGRRGDTTAFAADHAYLVRGLLELWQADGGIAHLQRAIALQERMDAAFWDEEGGGWFETDGSDDSVLIRQKESYDGAEPAAGSIAIGNLLRLAELTGEGRWRQRAGQALQAYASMLRQAPHALPAMVGALDAWYHGCTKVVVVGERDDATVMARLEQVRRTYLPHRLLVVLDADLLAALPDNEALLAMGDAAPGTVSICVGQRCLPPATDAAMLADQLAGLFR